MAFAETFKALSHPIRREILNLLKKKSLTAGEISEQFSGINFLKKSRLILELMVK